MKYADIASHILTHIGGKDNVRTSTVCMTRLRLNLTDISRIDDNELNMLESVLGIVRRGNHGLEIVFGPGIVEKIYEPFAALVGSSNNETEPPEHPLSTGTLRVQIARGAYSGGVAAGASAGRSASDVTNNSASTSANANTSQSSHTASSQPSAQTSSNPQDSPSTLDDDIASLLAGRDTLQSSKKQAATAAEASTNSSSSRMSTDDQTTAANNGAGGAPSTSEIQKTSNAELLGIKKILILNGPNINMLGIREPTLYGAQTYADLISLCQCEARLVGFGACNCYQSNHEGALVDEIQHACGLYDGIIFNPGAYTHTSIALLDALNAVQIPCIEVHISEVDKREDFRQISYIRRACFKTIMGMGLNGYVQAIHDMAQHLLQA